MRTLRMDRERTWSPAAKNEFADHLSQAGWAGCARFRTGIRRPRVRRDPGIVTSRCKTVFHRDPDVTRNPLNPCSACLVNPHCGTTAASL